MTQNKFRIESKDPSIEDVYQDFYAVSDFQWESTVGVNAQFNGVEKDLVVFDDRDPAPIECRQDMLARLAIFGWNIPDERKMPDNAAGEFAKSEGERNYE